MLLRKEKRGFQAKFISAPDDYLYLLAERDGATVPIDGALWIWPEFVSRGHVRRSFELASIPVSARLTLLCDNAFDVFINGREFSGEKHGDWFSLTDLDIKDALNVGVNHVALRLFGSSSLYKQISAISGGLIISYGDREERVLTDSSWECVAACNFYKKSEFEGWNTGAKAPKLRGLNVTPLHPRYKARSCYFRKSFSVTERVSSATLYATAEGLSSLLLTARCLTMQCLFPALWRRSRNIRYSTLPISSLSVKTPWALLLLRVGLTAALGVRFIAKSPRF